MPGRGPGAHNIIVQPTYITLLPWCSISRYGLVDSIHDFGISGGLCGQYVYPKSTAATNLSTLSYLRFPGLLLPLSLLDRA
jgi:hypothetical protein